MATLPEGTSLSQPVTVQRQPSLTWRINDKTKELEGTVDGLDAVRQAAEIILSCQRYRWQIYQPYSGIELDGLIGQDPGYVTAQVLRRVTEALTVDDRITGVSDFTPTVQGDTLHASMVINTVYGDTQVQMDANLA